MKPIAYSCVLLLLALAGVCHASEDDPTVEMPGVHDLSELPNVLLVDIVPMSAREIV